MDATAPQKLLRRSIPVAAGLAAFQALLLVAGWYTLYATTHEQVAESVEDVIVEANAAATRSISDAIGEFPSDLTEGSEDWERAQSVIEGIELPAGGFACLLDEDGFIACHPELRHDPSLRDVNLGGESFTAIGEEEGDELASLEAGTVTTGNMRFAFDGKHYVSTVKDEATGVQLVVHQPVSGLAAASRHITAGMVLVGLAIGAIICGATALLGFLLVRAHDREVLRWNDELEARVEEQAGQIRRAHRGIIFGIAKLAEYRDNETGMHVERMCAYSKVLAQELSRRGVGIDDEWIEQLRLAASLHDIGKVAIPDSVLLKPGRLTDEEFVVMRTHAQTGCDALEAVKEEVGEDELLEMGIEISGAHHEKWDGSGYPNGLAGTDIPLSARIVAVADVFDALMSKRVYKPAMPFEEVESIIEEGRGQHFDPAVVDAFHAVKGELLEIRRRLQDQAETPSIVPHRENEAVGRAA